MGASAPFFLYKNMKNDLEITYLEGQVIGVLKSIAELKNHELALVQKRNELEDKIEELKKENK